MPGVWTDWTELSRHMNWLDHWIIPAVWTDWINESSMWSGLILMDHLGRLDWLDQQIILGVWIDSLSKESGLIRSLKYPWHMDWLVWRISPGSLDWLVQWIIKSLIQNGRIVWKNCPLGRFQGYWHNSLGSGVRSPKRIFEGKPETACRGHAWGKSRASQGCVSNRGTNHGWGQFFHKKPNAFPQFVRIENK